MDEEDLMQECIGLLRAAKRFDASRGIRFSTYARWWVRAQMTRAIETTNLEWFVFLEGLWSRIRN